MLLTSDEHCIGRLVEDTRFQIASPAVSAFHCKIYRKSVCREGVGNPSSFCGSFFLKDSRYKLHFSRLSDSYLLLAFWFFWAFGSTNGTYINCTKLNKSSSEAALRHGDIISIAFAPQDGNTNAYNPRSRSMFFDLIIFILMVSYEKKIIILW